jgi:hypothetical protein
MAKNEKTSKAIATIASKALKNPSSITKAEIKKIAASVLTQAPDKKKSVKSKAKAKPKSSKKKK